MEQELTLDMETWEQEYRPVTNPIDENASYGGCLFETFGEELCFVWRSPPDRVWTLMDDGEGGTMIGSGIHLVNRLGYFVTERPFPASTSITVVDEEPQDSQEIHRAILEEIHDVAGGGVEEIERLRRALRQIADLPANSNSEPDVMGDVLDEAMAIAKAALTRPAAEGS